MSRRQFGSVRRLSSGRWQARYPGPNGAQMTAPTTFATKALAGAFLASVETDMRRGTWFDPTAATAVSLGEYAATWLTQRTVKGRPLAPRTLDTYRHSLEAWIVPTLGSRPLGEVGPADVRRWHQFVLSQTGPTAARQAYALLRAVFNTAVSDDIVPRNPCRIRGAGQPNSPERPLIDLDVVTALVDAMPEHLKAFTIVAFWGHARLGELLGLRVGDVDVAKGTLRIERQVIEVDGEGPRITAPKVGSIRTVHLPTPAVDALVTHLSERGETETRCTALHPTGWSRTPSAPRPRPLGDRSQPRGSARPALPRPPARRADPVSPDWSHPCRGHAPRRARLEPSSHALSARRRGTRRRNRRPHVSPRHPSHQSARLTELGDRSCSGCQAAPGPADCLQPGSTSM